MRVVWTKHAYAQLDEAMAFVARDRPNTATAWLERILDAGESLADFPDRGRCGILTVLAAGSSRSL